MSGRDDYLEMRQTVADLRAKATAELDGPMLVAEAMIVAAYIDCACEPCALLRKANPK